MPVEVVAITAWVVAILFAGWIFLQIRTEVEKNDRRQRRLCRNCGYDLRASPDICPECGLPSTADAASIQIDPKKLCDDWPTTPIAPRRPALGETEVVLYRTDNGFEAGLLKDQLALRGVAAHVQTDTAGQFAAAVYYRIAARNTHAVIIWSEDLLAAKAYLATLAKPATLSSETD
jgi:hypothetical protein